MRKTALISCLLLVCRLLPAQQFGGHPPSTKWKQINTDTVRVVFPAGLEKQAADVVATARALGFRTLPTIGRQTRKISIVLQPRTTVANGYVGLGPWRSELMLTPRQNPFELGSLSWHQYLTLHEYRHVQQYNNFRKGISKAFYYLFGQDGLALATSAAVPNWFWEGDAVYQETLMSRQGRGRLPFFFNDFRSLWAADKEYSWMKLRNGSLRDFVPDHYRLGYLIVAYGREKYGADFWRKVTDDAVRYKGLFYPFQRAVKKYAGVDYQSFRTDALNYFRQNISDNAGADSVGGWAAQQRHFSGDEEFPQWISDDSVIFVKSSYRHIPFFVIRSLSTGSERKIRVKDISLDNYFSYSNGRVVYAAYEPDLLWNWVDYSVLKVMNIHTGEQHTISRRSKYFSPDISADGKKVVTVEVSPTGGTALHVLDALTGAVLQKVPNPQHLFYTYPKFYHNETVVSAVRNREGAMTLALVNMTDGSVKELLPWSYQVAGFPQVQGDTITFTASRNGQDVLYAWANGKLFRANTQPFNTSTGNYQWSMQHGRAMWTAFTAAGLRLVVTNRGATALLPVTMESLAAPLHNFAVTFPDYAPLEPKASPGDTVTAYPKTFRLFNFHSWRPFITDPDYTFSLLSENILNTLQTELYFNYNRNEKFKEAGASLAYGGIFPWITASVSGTFDRRAPDTPTALTWNEWGGRLGLLAPFNLTRGRSYNDLALSAGINTRNVYFTDLSKTRDSLASLHFNYVDLSASFNTQSQQARMHIYPRLGNSLLARYRTIIDGYTANQLLLSNSVYLPGIAPTHNLVINAAFQGRDTMGNYFFSNSFPFSRGYTDIDFPRMWKLGVNYHFPLLYPDWGFGNMVYFLRVRANAFYDHSDVKSLRSGIHYRFRSAGAEIFFDTKWWNEYAVSFGIRYSRLSDGDLLGLAPNQWEFILPVNVLGR